MTKNEEKCEDQKMRRQYIIEVDESEIVECWNEQTVKEIGYQEYALNQCPGIKVKPYIPAGDLISREALKAALQYRSECGPGCTGMCCVDCFCDLIDNAPIVTQDCSEYKPIVPPVDLDREIELYKSKVAFYESQNTHGEYDVTARELKFVVETLEKLRSERLQGEGS